MENCVRFSFLLVLSFIINACGGGGGGTGSDPSTPPPSGSSPVVISDFAPTSGKVGTWVQISGVIFEEVPASNTVTFNGVAAQVIAATTTRLVVDVPAGATTGPITVMTSDGSGSTSSDFIVITDTTTPGVSWTSRLEGIPESGQSMATDGTMTVIASSDLFTSTDHKLWKEINLFFGVNDVMWDGNQFLAVGVYSNVYTSNAGHIWTQQPTTSGEHLLAVTKTATTWVAVGENGAVTTSTDGANWVSRASPTTETLRDIAWNGSTLVAIGDNATVMSSGDNGQSWTMQSTGIPNNISSIGAHNGMFVVGMNFQSGGDAAHFRTSFDGITWAPRTATMGYITEIKFLNGMWRAIGNYHVYESIDGLSWTSTARSDTNHIHMFNSFTYNNGEYVAAGSGLSSTKGIYTSFDATNWKTLSTHKTHTHIARSPVDGRLVVNDLTLQTLTSTDDGLSWTFGDTHTGWLFLDVEWSNALNSFVATSQIAANTGVHTSQDGISWIQIGNSVPNRGLVSSDTLLVAVGGGTNGGEIRTSSDGIAWAVQTNTATKTLNDVIWTGTQFIAFGQEGNIVTSPDGISWTKRVSGVTTTLNDAVSTPGLIIVVGDSGTLLTSDDNGVTWVSRNPDTVFSLYAIAWTGNEYVAVGNSAHTVRSTDGINWTFQPNQYNNVPFMSAGHTFEDLIWIPSGHLVGVGSRGVIATSP